jgi:hypothetical protein
MLAAGLPNPMQRLCRFRQGAMGRQIAERDDTNQAFVPIHDRKTSHLELRHVLGHMLNVLVLKAIFDFMTS